MELGEPIRASAEHLHGPEGSHRKGQAVGAAATLSNALLRRPSLAVPCPPRSWRRSPIRIRASCHRRGRCGGSRRSTGVVCPAPGWLAARRTGRRYVRRHPKETGWNGRNRIRGSAATRVRQGAGPDEGRRRPSPAACRPSPALRVCRASRRCIGDPGILERTSRSEASTKRPSVRAPARRNRPWWASAPVAGNAASPQGRSIMVGEFGIPVRSAEARPATGRRLRHIRAFSMFCVTATGAQCSSPAVWSWLRPDLQTPGVRANDYPPGARAAWRWQKILPASALFNNPHQQVFRRSLPAHRRSVQRTFASSAANFDAKGQRVVTLMVAKAQRTLQRTRRRPRRESTCWRLTDLDKKPGTIGTGNHSTCIGAKCRGDCAGAQRHEQRWWSGMMNDAGTIEGAKASSDL